MKKAHIISHTHWDREWYLPYEKHHMLYIEMMDTLIDTMEKDKEYIKEKGIEKIKEHAYTFINKRLAPKDIPNDGKQTPMKGHPVFISQHATATCCRNCLYKWHKIEPQKELNKEQIDYIVDVIMIWIEKEMTKVK